MRDFASHVMDTVEPLQDAHSGPRYRCSLTLDDGLVLPRAILQSRDRLVELATRRIRRESGVRRLLGRGRPDDRVVSTLVAGGHRVRAADVTSAAPSRYAIPIELLRKIKGETTMSWTGWVFRMRDGQLFAYGSSFAMEFFQLPHGSGFEDVEEVINHASLDASGNIARLTEGGRLPQDDRPRAILREWPDFICAIDEIPPLSVAP